MVVDAPLSRSFGARITRWSAALCVALTFAMPAPALPQAPRIVQVEAAFLVNFLRYTEWPRERFPDAATPFRIAVVGSSDTTEAVRAVAQAAGTVKGRRIEVERVPLPRGNGRVDLERLRGSHLVFLRDSDARTRKEILRGLSGHPVLTVGDHRDFAQVGGMLGIVRVDTHLGIEANTRAIESSGLQVSAKVLKLARIRRGDVE